MGYRLRGQMLEACTCEVICPCWVGRDADGGECRGAIVYSFEEGRIDDVDVSGLALGLAAYIPVNVTSGRMRVFVFMDESATAEQEGKLVEAFTGKAGGPLADFAGLIGEVVGMERVSMEMDVHEAEGTFRIGDRATGRIERLVGATGRPTTLSDTAISSIPGSPAYCGRSIEYRLRVPELGIELDISDKNAVQGAYLFEHQLAAT